MTQNLSCQTAIVDLMIAQMLKVIATTAAPHSLTREEKFQVFVNVCDNMLAEVESPKQITLAGLTFFDHELHTQRSSATCQRTD